MRCYLLSSVSLLIKYSSIVKDGALNIGTAIVIVMEIKGGGEQKKAGNAIHLFERSYWGGNSSCYLAIRGRSNSSSE